MLIFMQLRHDLWFGVLGYVEEWDPPYQTTEVSKVWIFTDDDGDYPRGLERWIILWECLVHFRTLEKRWPKISLHFISQTFLMKWIPWRDPRNLSVVRNQSGVDRLIKILWNTTRYIFSGYMSSWSTFPCSSGIDRMKVTYLNITTEIIWASSASSGHTIGKLSPRTISWCPFTI